MCESQLRLSELWPILCNPVMYLIGHELSRILRRVHFFTHLSRFRNNKVGSSRLGKATIIPLGRETWGVYVSSIEESYCLPVMSC
jgi:hypothetical protein